MSIQNVLSGATALIKHENTKDAAHVASTALLVGVGYRQFNNVTAAYATWKNQPAAAAPAAPAAPAAAPAAPAAARIGFGSVAKAAAVSSVKFGAAFALNAVTGHYASRMHALKAVKFVGKNIVDMTGKVNTATGNFLVDNTAKYGTRLIDLVKSAGKKSTPAPAA
ncbi:hypothetical protein COB21_00440 [Candidatus Aerophobetes bacterium]|uniref:Uncharacterized protein n=1 Tax=Aerophobetes bacterium TaxID=2030807 RepID=A0A2A4X7Q7_UNCAE|nr:MAG: hypothetical protein COB21_00440 [Candidatus Aerophobetes bacterium]